MDHIFSNSKNKFKNKDILYFIFICLLLLFDDFMLTFIKAENSQEFIFNEEYNSIEFILLFTISLFFSK